jgi:class 3 adenylate cyclase/pimeloyl-ACP methyl ester carboxylesterase
VRRDLPETMFAVAPDEGRVAYQVVGEGNLDLVLLTDWISSIDLMWEEPRIERFLRRLTSVGRLILFDKRGNGASDAGPIEQGRFGATMEQAAEDLLVVLDAVDSRRSVVVANMYGGWPALLFAATHPESCDRLVLIDCCARLVSDVDYPSGIDPATLGRVIEGISEGWGRGVSLTFDPVLWEDWELRRWYGRYERLAAERTYMLQRWRQMGEIDVRGALSLVHAPTLVIAHDPASPMIGTDSRRFLAEHIPSSELVELDGTSTFFRADERNVEHIIGFLGESVDRGGDEDRVRATVLFTDLVSSTEMVASLGDTRWRELLDAHDRLTGELIGRLRGRLIGRTGDGLLATFDGPARAVRCAAAICDEVRQLGVEVRAGVHAGEIELRGENVGGIAIHLAARVMSVAGGGEVVVSRTVKDLTAGSTIKFTDRGSHELKGIPDKWQLFTLERAG